jgi:hypothetical protein
MRRRAACAAQRVAAPRGRRSASTAASTGAALELCVRNLPSGATADDVRTA